MNRKELGKIEKVEFGHCGYQESFVGLRVEFKFNTCTHVSDDIRGGWYQGNEWTENCKWSIEGNRLQHAIMVEQVSQTLIDAKCEYISQLKGKPVELIIENNCLKSWRILTEVL